MTEQPDALFTAVDALLARADGIVSLPPPAERQRLRTAAGLAVEEVAKALRIRPATLQAWEEGTSHPKPEKLEPYRRLLEGLAARFPAPPPTSADPAVPQAFAGPAAPVPAPESLFTGRPAEHHGMTPDTTQQPAPASAPQTPAAQPPVRSASTAKPSTSRHPAAKKATPTPAAALAAAVDPRFANGPLAVVDVEDGQVSAYCVGGLVLDVPAKSIPALVDWTLSEARLGAPKLSGPGKDADPLIVLTEAACERYGLPLHLTEEERLSGRLPEGHKVIKQLARADWKLTKRGSVRGRGSTARRRAPSACACSCASRAGTRSIPGTGRRPGSFRRRNSPACWARMRPG